MFTLENDKYFFFLSDVDRGYIFAELTYSINYFLYKIKDEWNTLTQQKRIRDER
jgi:hypothetical protein